MEGPADDEIFCSACGERIYRSATFCRYCGEPNRYAPRDEEWDRRPPAGEDDRREPDHVGRDGVGRDDGFDDAQEHPPDHTSSPEYSQDRWDDPAPVDELGPAEEERDPDPWETDRARRIEARLDDDPGQERIPWRRYLPAVAREKNESGLSVVGKATGIGILGIVLLIVITIATLTVGSALGFSQTSMAILGTLIGQYVGFAGLALWYLRQRGFAWDDVINYLGVRWPSLKELGIVVGSWLVILVILIVVGVAIELVTELLDMGEPDEPEQALDDIIANNPEIVPAAILVMFLVVGPCEELLFRGVIQGRLREKFPAIPAILIASALFAFVHVIALAGSLQAVMLGIFVLFSTSIVIGAVYEYTESIVVASLLHGFHNSMVTLIIAADAIYDLEGIVHLVLSLPF